MYILMLSSRTFVDNSSMAKTG